MNAAQQQKVFAMFAAIDDEGQQFIKDMLEGEYERVQAARRPVLTLVPSGQVASTCQPVGARKASKYRSSKAQQARVAPLRVVGKAKDEAF